MNTGKAIAMLALLVSSGCYTTTIRSGLPPAAATVANKARWQHDLLLGIVELSGPHDLSKLCPQGWAEIETETSFLNGLANLLIGPYWSTTYTVRCAARPQPIAADAQRTSVR